MHTTDGCSIAGSDQSATLQTTNCFYQLNANSGCGSKLEAAAIPNNYGKPLNDNGGGVYVTEWTASYVKHWFFPRGAVPPSIEEGDPDISQFGKPTVNQQGPGCTIDEHFGNMNIVINTDFCGAWAGEVYSQFPECPQNPAYDKSLDRCVDYVGNNPSAFIDAYWEFNSIRVYQMRPGAQPASSYSTSLASTQPLPSTNTIDVGMGRSSSSVSSVPYTGPLSTLTSTSSLAGIKSSTSIPELPSDESGFFSNYRPTTTSSIFTFAATVSSTAVSSTSTPELPDESGFFSNKSPIYSSPVMASSTAGPSTSAACPAMNDQLITAPDGRVYHLYCSSDTSSEQGAYDIKDFPEGSNYDSCFSMCTADASCAAFIWRIGTITNGGGTCYVKRGAQTPLPSPDRPDLWAFVLVSGNSSPIPPSGVATPGVTSSNTATGSVLVSVVNTPPTSNAQPIAASAPCPYANGTEYVSSSGKVYQITCYVDESSNPSSSAYVSGDYALCVAQCEKTIGCVSITYSAFGGGGTGGFCSFRTSAGPLTPSDNSDVHLNLIPGKMSIIGPITTTTTTKFSSSSSSPAVASSSTNTGMGSNGGSSTGITSSGYQLTMSSSFVPDEDQPDPSTTMSDGGDATSVSTTSDDGDMPTSTMSDGGYQASTMVSATSSSGSTLRSTISSPGSTSTTSSSGALLTSISLPSLSLTAYSSSASLISSSSSAGSASSVTASPPSTSSIGSGSGPPTTTSLSAKTSTGSESSTVSLTTSSQRPSSSVSAAASGSSVSLSGSSSQSSSVLITTSMSMSSRATTSSTPSSSGVSSSTSSRRSSSMSYAPPPACPTSSSYYCMESNQQTTCSSGNNNYAIQCGILYEGTEIDTSNINEVSSTSNTTAENDDTATSGMSGTDDTSAAGATSDMAMSRLAKRATLPDAASCRNLCDRTSGCKAFNFVGNDCTLFSTVSGYSYAPGAIGGTVYKQGGAPPTPVDTSPSCPASAGKSFTDSMSTMYEIVCYTKYASGYTSDAPFLADNLANCLPTCTKNATCAGAVFDTTTRLCQLLVSTNGAQTPNNNNVIAALRVGGPPGYASPTSVPPTTVTTTLLPTSTLCEYLSL
jgi:hypothetical protein